MIAMAQWAVGGTSVMMAQIDLEQILKQIQDYRATTMFLPLTVIVVGVPDAKLGEAVKAVVQLSPGRTVDADELMALCREKLGSMKAPKSIEFWQDLTRSPVGKVLQREIRKAFWEGRQRNVS